MCEEGRPKVAGDPCATDTDCQPPSSTGSFDDVDRHHLVCDGATSSCVAGPDPIPSDWLARCEEDFTALRESTPEASAYGIVRSPSCSTGVCIFFERDTCVATGCGQPCEHDWHCPDGAHCQDSADWTDPAAPIAVRTCRASSADEAKLDCH